MPTSPSSAAVFARLAAVMCLALWEPAVAQPPPPPEMEAAHQVQRNAGERDWKLDPAIFIDLSPVTAAEPAVRLPEDQRDEPRPAPARAPAPAGERW